MANAIVAAIVSFFIPGLGQIYAGETKKGVIFLVISLIFYTIQYFTTDFMLSGVIAVIDLAYSLYAAYDAYQIAKY